MTAPLVLAGVQAAMTIATTSYTYQQQAQAAKQQAKQIGQANATAGQQTISDYDQMHRMSQQERAAASQKLQQNSIDTAKAVATASASASEADIGGLSVASLLGDIYGRSAQINDGVNQNLESTQTQMSVDATNLHRGLVNTVNTRPAVQSPSLLGTGLQAATGVFGAYKDELKIRQDLNKKT